MHIKRPRSSQFMPKEAKNVFSGVVFDVYQWEQKQFDGSYKTFEKVKRKDTATVIPITLEGKIVLTEQMQPGTKPFIGLPGGVIDDGEDPLEAARRELLEEAGMQAKTFILWDSRQLFSKVDWASYTFIAKGCEKVAEPRLDSGEKIELKHVSFDEFLHVTASEAFRDLEVSLKIFQMKEDPSQIEKLRWLFQS